MTKNGINKSAVLVAVFLLLVQGCGSGKSPFVPVEQAEAEVPAKTPEFFLGPGDKIEIMVYRHEELARSMQIDLSGKIMYPLLGDVQAAGLSIFALRDSLRNGLSKYILDPQVTVGVTTSQSQKIIVLGEVNAPGFFQADSAITVLEAISRAGGFTLDGKMKSVLLIRGGLQKPQLTKLNLEKTLKEGDLKQNVVLQRGDIVYVPRTVIADVDRFFSHMTTILQPLVLFETGIFVGQQIQRSTGGVSVAP